MEMGKPACLWFARGFNLENCQQTKIVFVGEPYSFNPCLTLYLGDLAYIFRFWVLKVLFGWFPKGKMLGLLEEVLLKLGIIISGVHYWWEEGD
jgi:hypothetical protein